MEHDKKATVLRIEVVQARHKTAPWQKQDDTWVTFRHACQERKGQEDGCTMYSEWGLSAVAPCRRCIVTVPEKVAERWRKMSALEREVLTVRSRDV